MAECLSLTEHHPDLISVPWIWRVWCERKWNFTGDCWEPHESKEFLRAPQLEAKAGKDFLEPLQVDLWC